MSEKKSIVSRLKPRLCGFLSAAGALVCAATLLGFLGRFSWILDLFSHFRVQYFCCLVLIGVLLTIGRRPGAAVALFAFACVNLALVLPLYFGKQRKPADSFPVLRAMLLNVNTRVGDAARVKDVVTVNAPDILVLEEISSGWMAALSWLTNSYPYCCAEPREDNFGIGIFSKVPIVQSEVAYIGAAGVPSIVATLDAGHTDLRLLATHPLPPGGREYTRLRNDQLESLPEHVGSDSAALLLGDLNITPWNYQFRRLLAGTGLRDSAKGYGVQPTWPSDNPLLRIPIDHCLHSERVVVLDRRIGAGVMSDHYPLIVDFVLTGESRKAGPTALSTSRR